MLCMHSFFQLATSYAHTRTLILSLLSMAVNRRMLSMQEARQKIDQLERQSVATLPSKMVLDQYRSGTNIQASTAEALTARLENELMFDDFTNME